MNRRSGFAAVAPFRRLCSCRGMIFFGLPLNCLVDGCAPVQTGINHADAFSLEHLRLYVFKGARWVPKGLTMAPSAEIWSFCEMRP